MSVLSVKTLEGYVDSFNTDDQELYAQEVSNADALAWMRQRVPLFECPDGELEQSYYFRWWVYRKHIKKSADGFVVTEYLPSVEWAGKHNAISCPAAHHFREGRWLRDEQILRDYALYWLRGGGSPRSYSFWIADSILAYCAVTGERGFAVELLPDLRANYEAWEASHRDANGLYWQLDDRDGMECSIAGALSPDLKGYRPTINSYMYGDAVAIARIAEWAGRDELAATYAAKASEIKRLLQEHLWDEKARFFKVLPRVSGAVLADVRELHGYTPWYFNIAEAAQSDAWAQLFDGAGFWAPYGPTTAEQRHRDFVVAYEGHPCQWNGPSWPFATAITLTGLANLLNEHEQQVVTRDDYYRLLKVYSASHSMERDDGRRVPWIDESLNPFSGEWLTRAFLKSWRDGQADPARSEERGKDYNHSTFCDLIINGLVGLRPGVSEVVNLNPLVPSAWDYFCLDGVVCRGKSLTVLFDRRGQRYGRGAGLRVLVDGTEVATAPVLQRLSFTL